MYRVSNCTNQESSNTQTNLGDDSTVALHEKHPTPLCTRLRNANRCFRVATESCKSDTDISINAKGRSGDKGEGSKRERSKQVEFRATSEALHTFAAFPRHTHSHTRLCFPLKREREKER